MRLNDYLAGMVRFKDLPESSRRSLPPSPEAGPSIREVPSLGGSPVLPVMSGALGSESPLEGERAGSMHCLRKLRPKMFQLGGSPDLEAGIPPSPRLEKPAPAKLRFRNPFDSSRRQKQPSVPPTPVIYPHDQCFQNLYDKLCKDLMAGAKKRLVDLQEDTERAEKNRDLGIRCTIRNHPIAVGPRFAISIHLGYVRLSAPTPKFFEDERFVLNKPAFDDDYVSPLSPELQYCTPKDLARFDVREARQDPDTGDMVWAPSTAFDGFVDMIYRLRQFAAQNNISGLRIALSVRGEGVNLHSHHGRCYEIDSFWLRAACPDINDRFE